MTLTMSAGGGGDDRSAGNSGVPAWFRELCASASVVMGAYVKGHGGVAGGPKPPSDDRLTAAVFTVVGRCRRRLTPVTPWLEAVDPTLALKDFQLLKLKYDTLLSNFACFGFNCKLRHYTGGEIAVQCNTLPPADCQTFIQALVAPELVPAAGVRGPGASVPVVVQAHAWTALGKQCLVSEDLAKVGQCRLTPGTPWVSQLTPRLLSGTFSS